MQLEDRLKTLSRLNANPTFINKQLYRMLYDKDFYILAYERLKTNKGAMTIGISNMGNVDGLNLNTVDNIIQQLRKESYAPQPSRRIYIPKANGKLRPLGLPNFKDKLVQECVKIILTCIYDSNENPTFSKDSYGFRPKRGCHHALKDAQRTFKGVTWCIKADVKSFFDEVDHGILIRLLKKRINDERFIRLIWKFLRCGHKENGQVVRAKKGTPQGGVLSPILSNIYLHEFDLFINRLKITHGVKTEKCPEYRAINSLLHMARKRLKASNKATDKKYEFKRAEAERLRQLKLNTPSHIVIDADKAAITYVRYADDWILGLKCTKEKAVFIYEACERFFREQLNLEWSKSKSMLVRSIEKDIEFLGVHMSFVNKRQQKLLTSTLSKSIKSTYRSVPMNTMRYIVKKSDICKRLAEKGFLDGDFNPISRKRMINLDVYEIARVYKSTMRGIGNYYGFVHNPATLNFIHYKLFMSFCKTLAHKFKSTKRKIMNKYGGKVLTFEGPGKAKPVTIQMMGGYKRNVNGFLVNHITEDTQPFHIFHHMRTASWLKLDTCCICKNKGYIEMHHVKHIRKIGQKMKGFNLVLQKINRKQIPVCLPCHHKIHNGQYDGLNLNKVATNVMKELGIKKWEDKTLSPQEKALISKKVS